MLRYIIKRLLYSIPVLLIIALASFIILDSAPGNPAEKILIQQTADNGSVSRMKAEAEKQFWIKKLGLDLPVFYFTLKPSSVHDSVYSNPFRAKKEELIRRGYSAGGWRNYVPVIVFHKDNRFKRWLFGDNEQNQFSTKGILHGDFGISYVTRQPVMDVIAGKIKWSVLFSIGSVLLAYLISIPLGVRMAYKNGPAEKCASAIIFIFYCLPPFAVAVLLLMLFSNPLVLDWFPSSGVKPVRGFPDGASFFYRLRIMLPYFVLPMICYTYSVFAFLTTLVKTTVKENLEQQFSITARAKGLSINTVALKHALPNSLLPLITVFANVFPAALGGSVILETLFTIPGMGLESYLAAVTGNYPVLVAIFTLTGFLTIAGYLVSDILYAVADKRIKL